MKNVLFATALVFVLLTPGRFMAQQSAIPFVLQPLPYTYDALEPYIDAETVQLHHDMHLGAYVNNLNAAVKGTEAENMTLEEILANTTKFDIKVRNNAGGVYNHNLYFSILGPDGGGVPAGYITPVINKSFGSFQNMQAKLTESAKSLFGSGWAWLYVTPEGNLAICTTANQDNPLMDIADHKGIPILGIDVWEHAYYLKYQNRRADYLEAFWKAVNWQEVLKRYDAAIRSLTAKP